MLPAPNRIFLHSSNVKLFDGKQLSTIGLFLFSDVLLLATPIPKSTRFTAKAFGALSECAIWDVGVDGSSRNYFAILFKKRDLPFIFAAKDEDEKRDWMVKINEAISVIFQPPRSRTSTVVSRKFT